jgi:Matrixin
MRPCVLLIATVLLATGTGASGFVLLGPVWNTSPVNMTLNLGASPQPLLDGSASFDASVAAALADWNTHMVSLRLDPVFAAVTPVDGDRVNNVFFSATLYGDSFDDAVAVTTEFSTRGRLVRTEADVIFNSNLSWDSYRGALRRSGGQTVYDIYRVALHEFGHVLGLDHPDEAGQSVPAIMNSFVSNTDGLQADDILGAHALYDAPIGDDVTLPADPATSLPVPKFIRPVGDRKTTSSPYNFAGTADPSQFRFVYLSNARLGKTKLYKVLGVERWTRSLKLKPGRNLIILRARGFDGVLREIDQRVLTLRRSKN